MAYASLADLKLIYGEINIDRLSVVSKEDEEAKVDYKAFLAELEYASNEIDSYLSQRYVLPFKKPPKILTRWACEIAYYKCSLDLGEGLSEERRQRYEDVFKRLADIVAKKADLAGLSHEDGEIPANSGSSKIIMGLTDNSAKRMFSRRKMVGI